MAIDQSHIEQIAKTADGIYPHEVKSSLLHEIRSWPKVTAYCLALTSTILLYGYDYVIVGTISSMPTFQQDFGEKYDHLYIIPSLWLAVWTASSPIGTMIGAAFGGQLQDYMGRRFALAIGAFLSVVAAAICYISDLSSDINSRRGVFLAGKGFQGFAIGIILCTTQTYMSEVLPTSLRGPILSWFPVFTLLGQMMGAIVIHTGLSIPGKKSYRTCFASQFAFSAIPLALTTILPESPAWLIRKGRMDVAFTAHQCLVKTRRMMDVQESFIQLQNAIAFEEQESHSNSTRYIDCFRKTNRRRTMIVAFANTVPQLFGLTLLAKSSYYMQIIGLEARKSITFLIVGIALGLASSVASFWTVASFRRRPLMLSSLAITTFLWLSNGIAGCYSGQPTIWYTVASLMAIIVVVGLGVWPCSYVVSAETSSLCLRSKTQGVGWFANGFVTAIFGFTLPYIFNPDEGDLRGKTGFVFAVFCGLAFVVTWSIIPEMKDRSTLQIDRMFELNLKIREFKSWKGEVERN